MPTAIYQIMHKFDAPKGGWSEIFFVELDDINAVRAAATAMAQFRALILGPPCTLEGVRITRIDPKPRTNLSYAIDVSSSQPNVVDFDGNRADTNWTGILTRLADVTQQYQVSHTFRGACDRFFTRTATNPLGFIDGDPTLVAWKNNWLNAAKFYKLRFRARSHEGVAGEEVDITAYDIDGERRLVITSAVTGQKDQKISIKGIETTGSIKPILNVGYHKIVQRAGNVITLNTTLPEDQSITLWASGKARIVLQDYFLINNLELQRSAHRDTGRPFGLGRGRRSARR